MIIQIVSARNSICFLAPEALALYDAKSDFTKPIFALSLIQLEEASKPPKSELLSEKSLPSHQPPIDAEALKVEKKDLPPNGAFFTQAAISDCGAFVAVATSSKRIFVVEVERGVSSVVSRAICKSATRILFHPHNASQLLVAENSGDVFVFDVCTGAYTCILGHVSMVSDVAFSSDAASIFSADKDEKVRKSRFPQGHIIEAFCLGHAKFVSKILTISRRNGEVLEEVLVAGGGDAFLSVWNAQTAKLQHKFSFGNLLEETSQPIAVIGMATHGTRLSFVLEGVCALFCIADVFEASSPVERRPIDAKPLAIGFDCTGVTWTATDANDVRRDGEVCFLCHFDHGSFDADVANRTVFCFERLRKKLAAAADDE